VKVWTESEDRQVLERWAAMRPAGVVIFEVAAAMNRTIDDVIARLDVLVGISQALEKKSGYR